MNQQIRIIATENPLLVSLLRNCADVEIAALVADSEEAVDMARTMQPDIVIIDIVMPRLNNAAAIEQIRAAVPKCRILVLSAHCDEKLVVSVVSAGANGYLATQNLQDGLCDAIEVLSSGNVYYDSDVVKILATKLAQA